MKIAVMQPYLFPYLGYFQLMNAVDRFVIFDDVSFINKGWINRNNILVNKEKHLFTMPLIKSGQNKLIKALTISEPDKWKSNFLRTLETSYKHSENFNDAFGLISEAMHCIDNDLSGFILNSFRLINNYLDIKTGLISSSSVYLNSDLKGQERIIDICKKENAAEYYNLPGGAGLYSEDSFKSKGIDLKFIKPNKITYKQFDDNFTESLSIIDVLMFNSKENIKGFLNEYETI